VLKDLAPYRTSFPNLSFMTAIQLAGTHAPLPSNSLKRTPAPTTVAPFYVAQLLELHSVRTISVLLLLVAVKTV
jgi:hypothetical protein